MDLRRLGYLLAVVDHGGFTNAAKAVFVSQPALSLGVKELEEELGVQLVYRLGRGVRLTPAGEALVGPARQALRDIETAKSAVASVAGVETGSLALGSLPTLAAEPLAELVGRFRTAHPGVVVELPAPEDTAALVAVLRERRCEIGLVEGVALPAELATHDLAPQRLVVVLPPGTARRRADLLVEELKRLRSPRRRGPPAAGSSIRRSQGWGCHPWSLSWPRNVRPSCPSSWRGRAPPWS